MTSRAACRRVIERVAASPRISRARPAPVSKKGDSEMKFWSDRRGAVEIATFSNPPHNYLDKPVIDELEQLVVQWREPAAMGDVIRARPHAGGLLPPHRVDEPYRPGGAPRL